MTKVNDSIKRLEDQIVDSNRRSVLRFKRVETSILGMGITCMIFFIVFGATVIGLL
jgi:hypothetical protein